jgi:hypothetical protein
VNVRLVHGQFVPLDDQEVLQRGLPHGRGHDLISLQGCQRIRQSAREVTDPMALDFFRGQVTDVALEGRRGNELAADTVGACAEEAGQEEIGLGAVIR